MTRRLLSVSALTSFLLVALPAPSAVALDEAARLWLVGERAFGDGLHALARRTLERFVAENPTDARMSSAVLLLGRTRLALGDAESALEAFRRLRTLPPAGEPMEAKFWEAEALLRVKRLGEARAAYDEVVRKDATSPLAPDALYGLAWTDLELRRPEAAAKEFRDLLTAWPNHPQAGSATYSLARALVELKRFDEAIPLLQSFPAKFSGNKLIPSSQYLLGWARVTAGQWKDGVDDLRAFVAAYPSHELAPEARRKITETQVTHGSRAQQQSVYTQLMNQSPPTPEALFDAAGIAGRLNQPKEQEAAWRRLRKEFPDHPLALNAAYDLAAAAFKRKDWKEAAAQAKAAAASDEDGLRARALLMEGESELKLKRFKDAAKSFEGVVAVKGVEADDRYRALAGLGLAREELQDLRGALGAYDAVAAKSPNAELRDWARNRASAIKGRLAKPPAPATGDKRQ